MTKTAWPLYLTIAVASAASMATSPPPSWWEARVFRGPDVKLDEERTSHTETFTVHASIQHASPVVEVYGLVRYELAGDAPQDLRVALVVPDQPDQNVLAEQIHLLDGTGRLQLKLGAPVPLACASGGEVCEQALAVEIDAGSVSGGVIDVEWYLRAETSGDGAEPPEDLVFEVDFEAGQAVDYIPDMSVSDPPIDIVGDGRWLISQYNSAHLYIEPSTALVTQRFSVSGKGSFSSSALSVLVTMYTNQPAPVDFRVAVVPEEPTMGLPTERIVTVAGDGYATFELALPELLDCGPSEPCRRDYTLVFEAADELSQGAAASIELNATIDGQGDAPPADAELVIEVETLSPM